MRNLPMECLRSFVTVAEVRGFTQAGQLLGRTQPAISMQIKKLETDIGLPLTEICIREYTDPKQRQLFKNIIYVGVLAELLAIDSDVVEQLRLGEFDLQQVRISAGRGDRDQRNQQ